MRTYCKQIPEYILEAAKGNMTSETKDNSITSKMSLKTGKPAGTIIQSES